MKGVKLKVEGEVEVLCKSSRCTPRGEFNPCPRCSQIVQSG